MDPTTSLYTFFLETHSAVESVHLFGSWDNFTQPYTMVRDSRRGGGQWRGCHTFRDVLNAAEAPHSTAETLTTDNLSKTRTGGLRMGHTYFYYYELDRASETYNTSMPHTNACPFLPGQAVNILDVPLECSLRQRSASLTSIRQYNYRTMNPEAKFQPLRPPPSSAMSRLAPPRLGSAPVPTTQSRPSSPPKTSSSASWRRFLPRKRSLSSDLLRQPDATHNDIIQQVPSTRANSSPPVSTSSRDMSPESLRRFLQEDTNLPPESPRHKLDEPWTFTIPDNLDEEDEGDDANFASPTVSELPSFGTSLFPPPARRSASSDGILSKRLENSSSLTLTPTNAFGRPEQPLYSPPPPPSPSPPSAAIHDNHPQQEDDYMMFTVDTRSLERDPSTCCSSQTSPSSPRSMSVDGHSGSDSGDDVDAIYALQPLSAFGPAPGFSSSTFFRGYSLPTEDDERVQDQDGHDYDDVVSSPSERLEAQRDSSTFLRPDAPTILRSKFSVTKFSQDLTKREPSIASPREASHPLFLTGPIETGIDDFASELGSMVNYISSKRLSALNLPIQQ